MDFKALYNEKKCSPQEIAALVESRWRIGMDTAVSHAPTITEALVERAMNDEVYGVRVQSLLDVQATAHLLDPKLHNRIIRESWFSGSGSRQEVNHGMADVIPNYYRDIPSHIRRQYEYDVFCASVSPMDKHGYFSLGTVSSYSGAMLEKSHRIFLEVNDQIPRAICGPQIHISQVDKLIEVSRPLPELAPTKTDSISETIGGYIAELIEDGSCIQLGIGAIPDAVGAALKSKHDLGIHTEMFTNSMVDLLECGAVNNSKKQIYRGQSVTTFAYGSRKLYDYIDDNPGIAFLPVDYVNDPAVISQNRNMISINAALECDIWGQVCAESVGTKHMSGTGGQVDYVRGASQSKGGKSFIAFTSTAKDGTISRIKSTLEPGAIVTTSKNDVDYIVTEYGIAHMRGEPLSSRARQLIAIAHPDFRGMLAWDAKKRGIMI